MDKWFDSLFFIFITGLYDNKDEEPQMVNGINGDLREQPAASQPGAAVLLKKDPVMLLNEHCQRSQLKV